LKKINATEPVMESYLPPIIEIINTDQNFKM